MSCDQNRTLISLSAYCLLNICFFYGPTEGTHREARIWHKTVNIIFIASCQFVCCRSQTFSYQQLQQLIFSVYFCSRLRVSFSPCNQTFQIPPHISHPVDVLQFHSIYVTLDFSNHCIRSTASTTSKKLSKIFLHVHHSLGQPLLMRCHGCSGPGRFQDSKMLRRHVKTATIIMHLKITCGFTETRQISWKKVPQNHCIYQFQSLSRAWHSPKKERWKQPSAFHIIPFHSAPTWHHHTTEGHTSQWI